MIMSQFIEIISKNKTAQYREEGLAISVWAHDVWAPQGLLRAARRGVFVSLRASDASKSDSEIDPLDLDNSDDHRLFRYTATNKLELILIET